MSQKKRSLPSKEEILHFIQSSEIPLGKRELAKAFNIKGDLRVSFKQLLNELAEDGLWTKKKSTEKNNVSHQSLPPVLTVEVTSVDDEGAFCAVPEKEAEKVILGNRSIVIGAAKHNIKIGSRLLVKLEPRKNYFKAEVIRILVAEAPRVVGVYNAFSGEIRSVKRKDKNVYKLTPQEQQGLQDKDIVFVHNNNGQKTVKKIGTIETPGIFSTIAIATQDLPSAFSENAIKIAEKAKIPPLEKREDLRHLPLVTIDGEDARDFDDAVFAEKTKEGWHLIVAIADVAYYVHPDDALDKEAQKRGNSVYLPDRVVPMLPEALSNEMCSLKPHVDRACMVAHLFIDQKGQLTRYKFTRGLMRSQARLTYEEVQRMIDGILEDNPLEDHIKSLYGAYHALVKGRKKRGTLDLDLPEYKVDLDAQGRVRHVKKRVRLDSHRLIEEFMIMANVAAASILEDLKSACVYRIHDEPDPVKVDALRHYLMALGIGNPRLPFNNPTHFAQVLDQVKETQYTYAVNDFVLRTQSQARYSIENHGHFGLSLKKYAHFTSPIRRYADLLVHRAIIKSMTLGEGPMTDAQMEKLEDICIHISQTERAAAEAERDVIERYMAQYLDQRVGAIFEARLNGINNFGMFVVLNETGANGFIPLRFMRQDYFVYDEHKQQLYGRRTGMSFSLGEFVEVKLVECDVLSGSLTFEIDESWIEKYKLTSLSKTKKKMFKKSTKENPKEHPKKNFKRGKPLGKKPEEKKKEGKKRG